jgi:hypothetical protein
MKAHDRNQPHAVLFGLDHKGLMEAQHLSPAGR